MTDRNHSSPKAEQSAVLEWSVAAVSAVIIIALAGLILYEALTHSGGHPRITFEKGAVYAMGEGFGFDVTVHNRGLVAISDVNIEAVSLGEEGQAETGSVTLDYLGAESTAEIGFGFSHAPDPAEVTLRAVGFTYP